MNRHPSLQKRPGYDSLPKPADTRGPSCARSKDCEIPLSRPSLRLQGRRVDFGQDHQQEGGHRSQEQRQQEPDQSASILSLSDTRIEQRESPPPDKKIRCWLHQSFSPLNSVLIPKLFDRAERILAGTACHLPAVAGRCRSPSMGGAGPKGGCSHTICVALRCRYN